MKKFYATICIAVIILITLGCAFTGCGQDVRIGEWIPAPSETEADNGDVRIQNMNAIGKPVPEVAVSHAHSFVVKKAVLPTCVKPGFTVHSCWCGDFYISDEMPAKGHVWKAATCVSGKTCGTCGVTEGAALEHRWVDATCAKAKICADCGLEEGAALGHDYTGAVAEPTCTQQGYTAYSCDRCGDRYVSEYVDAIGHRYTEASCVAPAACAVCGKVNGGTADHEYSEWETVQQATCTKKGREMRSCVYCGACEARDVKVGDHAYKAVAVNPTCTQEGYTLHTCDNCQDAYMDSFVEAAGHSWGAWKIVKEATFSLEGQKERVCDKCNAKETAEIEKKEDLVLTGVYKLRGGFGFYKGSMDKSKIRTITFSRNAPKEYDECWNANVADTEAIKGYRVGTDVFIVGDHIYANHNCSRMFAAYNAYGDPLWSSLTEINGLELLDVSRATQMKMMFAYQKLEKIEGISGWDVSSVIDMTMMFAHCTNLTSLDIADWNVSKVRDFTAMFQGNSNTGDMNLQELDVSRWNVGSAKKMGHMFYGCSKLTHIAVDNWDVRQVTTFTHMFADCYSLQSINFSNWETLSVRSFDAFLNDCRSLVRIDVSGLDTATCRQFSQMFESCISLEEIVGLDAWDVSNADNYAFSETFHNCPRLKALDLHNWSTVKADNMARMFKGCASLVELDLRGFCFEHVETVMEMFSGCKKLTEIVGIENWDLSDIDGYDSMYSGTFFD